MNEQIAFVDLELPRISVMSLKPEDVLVFSTPDNLSIQSYQKIEEKIIDWKRKSGIINTHLLLIGSLELKVLRPEKADDNNTQSNN